MLLIADSGSTKTAWRFRAGQKKVYSFHTAGLNPFFLTSTAMAKEINRKCPAHIKSQISNSPIFFYGAGCSSPSRNKIILKALKNVFPKARAKVEHDLLGAARALCGNEKGIACILGTGSNSCFYDGKKITRHLGGLGYILGDEGSGKEIGKKILNAFLNNRLPGKLQKMFSAKYRLDKENILHAVYHQPNPNVFLASFSKFAGENISEPFLYELVKKSLAEFFDSHIGLYENHREVPCGFVGSVGFYFQHILKEIAEEKNVIVNKIIESPVDELVQYHLNEF